MNLKDLLVFFFISMTYSVMDGHMSRVFGLTYHPTDPHILVSAGWDDTLQVCTQTIMAPL